MRDALNVFTVFLFSFGVSGAILNFIVCVMFFKNPELLSDASNIFILNIAVGDFTYLIVAVPLLIPSNVRGRWLFGEAGCTAEGFFTTLFGLGSMMHLAGAAYERYFTLNRLVYGTNEESFGKKNAIIFSLLLWCYSLFWSLMPILGWSSYVPEGIGTSCSINWRSRKANDVSFSLCLILACFVLPTAVIIYCYFKCYKTVHVLAEYAKKKWGENIRVTKEIVNAERKVMWTAFSLTVGFLFAWTPYAISSGVVLFNPSLVSDVSASIPAYIAKMSACYNPFIYVFMNSELIRKLLRKIFYKK